MDKILKYVFVILGTFLGAGFASGKEIYIFFFQYGYAGFYGLILSIIIISASIFFAINISKKNKNKYNKKLINYFFIISFGVMVSGLSSLIKQEINNYYLFLLIKIIIFFIIFLLLFFCQNTDFFIAVNSIIMPIIIFFIIYFFIIFIEKINGYYDVLYFKNNNEKNVYAFFISIFNAFIYAGYNMLAIIPVIFSFENKNEIKENSLKISLCFGAILFVLAFCVISILKYNYLIAERDEIPILAIISQINYKYKIVYLVLIALSIITSVLSIGKTYLIQSRFQNKTNSFLVLIICALISSQFSFSKLIEFAYLLWGGLGIWEIKNTIYGYLKIKKRIV